MKIGLIGLNTEAYQKYLRERSELPGVTLLKPNQSNESFLVFQIYHYLNKLMHVLHMRFTHATIINQNSCVIQPTYSQYCTSQNPKNINNSISIHSSIHRVAVLFILSTVKHSKHICFKEPTASIASPYIHIPYLCFVDVKTHSTDLHD